MLIIRISKLLLFVTTIYLGAYYLKWEINNYRSYLYFHTGVALANSGNLKRGKELVEKAILIQPRYHKFYYEHGVLCLLEKNWEMAKISFICCEQLFPDFSDCRYYIKKLGG